MRLANVQLHVCWTCSEPLEEKVSRYTVRPGSLGLTLPVFILADNPVLSTLSYSPQAPASARFNPVNAQTLSYVFAAQRTERTLYMCRRADWDHYTGKARRMFSVNGVRLSMHYLVSVAQCGGVGVLFARGGRWWLQARRERLGGKESRGVLVSPLATSVVSFLCTEG